MFLRPSTRAFAREARAVPDYSLFDLLHGYVYARWAYLYISIAKGEHPLASHLTHAASFLNRLLIRHRGSKSPRSTVAGAEGKTGPPTTFADSYHGKVVPLRAATQLVTVRREISLKNLEQVVPYTRARDLVLKNPDHIVVMECPCRASKPNPCTPVDVCVIVGEPFASFILEHHPTRARRITQAEAVEILREEDERGHVHHAFFKDAMLGRFYAICNCCACCCGAMQIHQRGIPMLASSGYVSQVDNELCIACGTCAESCQFEALRVIGTVNTINYQKCMGCGICTAKCDHGALSLVRDPAKVAPLEIRELMAEAEQMGLAGKS